MKARILDEQVKVYSSMDANAVSIATLPKGTEIELGPAKRRTGKLWVPIVMSTGQQAFIPGEARINIIRQGALLQNNVKLLTEPKDDANVKLLLSRNTNLEILQVVDQEGYKWVKVRDSNNNEGFINGNTRIRLVQQKTKAMGRKNMVSGGMWLLAGLILTFSNNTATSGGMFNLFGYGAILLGAGMLIMGLVQFLTAPV
jgi:hypothetical protein